MSLSFNQQNSEAQLNVKKNDIVALVTETAKSTQPNEFENWLKNPAIQTPAGTAITNAIVEAALHIKMDDLAASNQAIENIIYETALEAKLAQDVLEQEQKKEEAYYHSKMQEEEKQQTTSNKPKTEDSMCVIAYAIVMLAALQDQLNQSIKNIENKLQNQIQTITFNHQEITINFKELANYVIENKHQGLSDKELMGQYLEDIKNIPADTPRLDTTLQALHSEISNDLNQLSTLYSQKQSVTEAQSNPSSSPAQVKKLLSEIGETAKPDSLEEEVVDQSFKLSPS